MLVFREGVTVIVCYSTYTTALGNSSAYGRAFLVLNGDKCAFNMNQTFNLTTEENLKLDCSLSVTVT